jgi:hypothetical protein
VMMDAWWIDESQARQDAVRGLLAHLHDAQDDHTPMIVCGDKSSGDTVKHPTLEPGGNDAVFVPVLTPA